MVNVSTKRGLDVPPCIIEANEHPSISERSYVRCEYASLPTLEALQAALAAQVISLSKLLAEPVLSRVQRALLESEHTTYELKGILDEQGFGRWTAGP